jgi:tRNA threonylcarbamoyl adenosine modification protein (Sua5/YciO/YrdC/YwlC family)
MAEAVERLGRGELVAYATETVYGLGADARSEQAVGRLRAWKGRSEAQPLSVLVGGPESLEALGACQGPTLAALLSAFWPGPLTVVLRVRAALAPGVARPDGAVGFRCSSHPVAAGLARSAEAAGIGPITATSLNRTGQPAARNLREARALCAQIPPDPWLLADEAADAGRGLESSVLDLTGPRPRVLRAGAIPAPDLEALL